MEMALLLVAGDRIIRRVEVRHEDTSEVSKGLFEEGAFPGRMIEVNDDLRTRECPDITGHRMLDLDLRLVGKDEHPGSQPVQHAIHSDPVNLSQASLGTLSDPATVTISEYIIYA